MYKTTQHGCVLFIELLFYFFILFIQPPRGGYTHAIHNNERIYVLRPHIIMIIQLRSLLAAVKHSHIAQTGLPVL